MKQGEDLKRLKATDIQRLFYWMFNRVKRPSFSPLRIGDVPETLNLVQVTDPMDSREHLLGERFGISYTVSITEGIPFEDLPDCLVRDVADRVFEPSFTCITEENLRFLPKIELARLTSSEVFVNSGDTLDRIDFTVYKRPHRPTGHKVLALDVEKVTTTGGKEVGRVTLASTAGEVVYDQIVRPRSKIVSYETRYSGLTKEIVDSGIGMEEAKREVLDYIGTDTVVVGHGIENDLTALEIFHDKIIDTAYIYLNSQSRRLSLSQLAKVHLNKTIHEDVHDSAEDALICLELLSLKIQQVRALMDEETEEIGINAKIRRVRLADLSRNERGCLNIVRCSLDELMEQTHNHKRNRDFLYFLLYQRNGKTYLSF
jgi:RNA exonuclease 1